MTAIRCVRVDPPARPSRREVIVDLLTDTQKMTYGERADLILDNLDRREADTPAPTYRIELDAEAFEALLAVEMPADMILNLPAPVFAILRAAKGCMVDGVGEAKIGPEPPNDGEGLAEVDVPVHRVSIPGEVCIHCHIIMGESLVCPGCGWVDPLTKSVPDPGELRTTAFRCPGNTITAEELAQAFWDAAANADNSYNDWDEMGDETRRFWSSVAFLALARFFPEHIAKPAEPVAVAESDPLYGAPDATFSAGHKDWRQATLGELYGELIELQGILAEYKVVIAMHHADFRRIKVAVGEALGEYQDRHGADLTLIRRVLEQINEIVR
jgi:hypothetical protein